jgi:Zn-dependent protease with chaperone function
MATGSSLQGGSVVVTRGLLEQLDYEALETVLAHELAHLVHRDALYIVQAVAFVLKVLMVGYFGAAFVILVIAAAAAAIALIVAALAQIGETGGDDNGLGCLTAGVFAIALIAVILEWAAQVAAICSLTFGLVTIVVGLGVRLAASSVSHSREFLADAFAAQVTRNPAALARALARIAQSTTSAPARGMLLQPLLFGRVVPEADSLEIGKMFSLIYSSHPKIDHRICALTAMAPLVDRSLMGIGRRSSRFREALELHRPFALSASLVFMALAAIPWDSHPCAAWFPKPLGLAGERPVSVERTGWVTQDGSRLREEPFTRARVLAKLPAGARVEVLHAWARPTGNGLG